MIILGFIIGAILGSFIKATADRVMAGKSLLGRSKCDHCHKSLTALDLFPIFSFLLLKGKCRYCQKKLSVEYLLVEVVCGILVAIIFAVFPFSIFLFPVSLLEIAFKLFAFTILAIIFLIDLKTGYIPDKITYPGALISLIFLLLIAYFSSLWMASLLSVASGLAASLFFAILILVTFGKGMGWGDVKFVFLLGLFLGHPKIIVGLFLAFLLGALAGLLLIALGRKHFGETLPFGPFLSLGAYLALVWGDQIISWYLTF